MTDYLVSPAGRIVQGSLYEPQTKNADGKPLITQAGEPRVQYYIGFAVPKNGETHWSQTEWGAKIYTLIQSLFSRNEPSSPNFAWKITDGDSTVPNQKGIPPSSREGYAGHWVLNVSNGFAPKIYNREVTEVLTAENLINPGDYIQIVFSVANNGSSQNPGIFLNFHSVAFLGYGVPIKFVGERDDKALGLGQVAMPAAASATPIASITFNNVPTAYTTPAPVFNAPTTYTAPTPVAVTPHTAILVPAPAPVKTMTALAKGATYDQFIQQGWTDALLIQHGYMHP